MLRLHGFTVSNYYNVVKAALLEKAVSFEEVTAYPAADKAFLSRSPMGKVPCLETGEGVMSESQVMLDYLEEVHPEPRLYPATPFARAKVRELLRVIELYLELPARRLYPEAFFGGSVSDATKREVRAELAKGVSALQRLARFEPYLGGSALTYADLAAAIHLPLIGECCKRIYQDNPLAELPALQDYLRELRARDSLRRVGADAKAGFEAYTKALKQR